MPRYSSGRLSSGDKAIVKYWENQMSREIKDLVSMAKWDVNYGPHSAEDFAEEDPSRTPWPGYFEAIDKIQKWADDHLCTVWYDNDTGEVLENEPESYTSPCQDCDGTGKDYTEISLDELDEETPECKECDGSGKITNEPNWDEIHEYDKRRSMRVLFGDLVGNGL